LIIILKTHAFLAAIHVWGVVEENIINVISILKLLFANPSHTIQELRHIHPMSDSHFSIYFGVDKFWWPCVHPNQLWCFPGFPGTFPELSVKCWISENNIFYPNWVAPTEVNNFFLPKTRCSFFFGFEDSF
jgi:hypothetical protein